MYISKRSLGEGYIVAIGVVLGIVLGAQTVLQGSGELFWLLAAGVSVAVLVGAVYWLHRFELSSDQVWLVSNCSALSLGLGTTAFVLVDLATTAKSVTTVEVAVLGTALGASAVFGALSGIAVTLHRSNRDLRGQNAVLHRILRHNLRNDMSVVLCLLDDIEANTDGETRETAIQARAKIQSFVRLTDRVRQANVGLTDSAETRKQRDVTDIVESRVVQLRRENPDLSIDMELPDQALASVGETFDLVIDNIVESALSDETCSPHLALQVEKDRETVRLLVEDDSMTIPDADFSAVATGSETALEHGLGVELWLVEWLVDANDGDVAFETADGVRRVTIELDRARAGWRE